MPKAPVDERLMEQCVGCRKALAKSDMCSVFKEPKYQWQGKKCFGYEGTEVIYLAGSINGHPIRSANKRRLTAQRELEQAGYVVLNPLRDRSDGIMTPSKEIVERDLKDIERANILLVEMNCYGMSYIGTSMEIREAYLKGKTIYLWGEANKTSHWLAYHATRRFKTLQQALDYLKKPKNKAGLDEGPTKQEEREI
jgi:nucleoside 2-deoxyribosyltransferase